MLLRSIDTRGAYERLSSFPRPLTFGTSLRWSSRITSVSSSVAQTSLRRCDSARSRDSIGPSARRRGGEALSDERRYLARKPTWWCKGLLQRSRMGRSFPLMLKRVCATRFAADIYHRCGSFASIEYPSTRCATHCADAARHDEP